MDLDGDKVINDLKHTKEQTPSSSAKKIKFWDFIKIALALCLLGFVVSNTDLQQLLSLRYRISLQWLGVAFVFFCIMTILKASQYHFLIGRKLPYLRVLGVVVLQNAISNFVATSAGIASQLALMSAEKNVRLSRAAFSFLIAKLGDLIAVSIFLLISSFAVWPRIKPVHGIVITVLVLVVLIVALFMFLLLMREYFVVYIKRVLAFVKVDRFALVQRGIALMEDLALQDPKKILRLALYGTVYAIVYMLATIAWNYARYRMFSLTLGMDMITFVVSTLQYASWIPVSVFGGLGISETLSVYLFGLFGLDKSEMAAVLIGSRLVFYLMNAISLLYLPLDALLNRNINNSSSVND